MRYVILFFLIVLLSCDDGDTNPVEHNYKVTMQPHTTEGVFYEGTPIQLLLSLPYEDILETTISLGDGRTETAPSFVFAYNDAGTYTITSKIVTRRTVYESKTQIQVVPSPKVIGDANTAEHILGFYKTSGGRHNLLVEYDGTITSSQDFYLLKINDSLVPETKVNVAFSAYTILEQLHADNTGTLAIQIGRQVKILSADGVLSDVYHEHYPSNSLRDIKLDGDKLMILVDSINHAITNTIELPTSKKYQRKRFIGVEGMTVKRLFFTSLSSFAVCYNDNVNKKTLVTEIEIEDKTLMNQYIDDDVNIIKTTPTSSGLVMNTGWTGEPDIYAVPEFVDVLKINEQRLLAWRKRFKSNTTNYYYPYYPASKIIVKESAGFIYIFFDNMRCIKLRPDGKVLWDRFFYSVYSQLEGAEVTDDGNFIMVGIRHPLPDYLFSDVRNTRDIIIFKISPEGERLN